MPTPIRLKQLRSRLWEERKGAARSQVWLLRVGRYTFALGRDLLQGELSMRAMSLVYTTLLSLVPFLALGFSVLKALGVHNSLEPALEEFLRPLGPQGAELTANLIGFVEKIQVGVLGSLGVALLFYTAISLIQKVEASFNFVWRIQRPRPFAQRVGEYLGVLMVGPVVVFTALAMTASILNSSLVVQIKSIEPFGSVLYGLTRLVPYAMIVGMFTFLYAYMPNTRVRFGAALIGGLAAGLLWQTASFAFTSFVSGATNYNAIYSGFAIVIFLLIWLYLGWLILLIGCQLTFYIQHPAHLVPATAVPLPTGRQSEYLAMLVMASVGRRFLNGEPAMTQEQLANELRAVPEHVGRAVETLIDRGYIAETGPARAQLQPARDLEAVSLGELWRAVRDGPVPVHSEAGMGRQIFELIDHAERGFMANQGAISVREWLRHSQDA
ncbi:MAG: YihY/virulence factor BrkB family protein [Panacagrimonas sp.]